MKEMDPLKDSATVFSSEILPELKEIIDKFNQSHHFLTSLDLGPIIFKQDLARRLFEDCYAFPQKEFYWMYEQEVGKSETFAGREAREINSALREYLANYFKIKSIGAAVNGWKPKQGKLVFQPLWEYFKIFKSEIIKRFGVEITGTFYYPPGGYREWHTNADKPAGWRMYYIRIPENGKSWFNYINPRTQTFIQVPDQDDCFVLFYLPDIPAVKSGERPDYFWHCVVSKTHRRSLGFRVPEDMVRNLLERVS